MKKLRSIPKNRIILWAAALLLAIACLVCVLIRASLAGELTGQRAAERFRGDSEMRFAQVSAFFPDGSGKALTDIYTFRNSVDSALLADSLEAEEGKSLWMDAYCAQSQVAVTGSKGKATVTTLGVGGDWFAFHDLKLRSGGYISESDLMHDRVVLDETLAWRLFGGFDLEGMEVTIGGKPYIVAGVVSLEDDFASLKAAGDGAVMFMAYDAMNSLTEDGVKITSYELVCADPITGFALSILQKGFADADTVENTGRFSLSGSLELIKNFGARSMVTTAVAYPYWENAARLMEDYTALLLTAAVLLGLLPLILLISALVRLIRRGWAWLKDWTANRWERLSDNVRERQRLRLVEKARREDEAPAAPEEGPPAQPEDVRPAPAEDAPAAPEEDAVLTASEKK